MGRSAKYFWELLHRFRLVLLGVIAVAAYFLFLWGLRNSSYLADPMLDTFLEMAGSLIAFTFAANAMIRFRGMHDRISLILAFGFILAGLIEAGSSMTFYPGNARHEPGRQPNFPGVARRAHAARLSCLLAALVVERAHPTSRATPAKEIAGATLIVGAVAYLTSVFYFMVPDAPKIHPGAFRAASLGSAAGGDLRCGHHRLRLAVAPRKRVAGPRPLYCVGTQCHLPPHDQPNPSARSMRPSR